MGFGTAQGTERDFGFGPAQGVTSVVVPDMPTLSSVYADWIAQASDLSITSSPDVDSWQDDTATHTVQQATAANKPHWDSGGEYVEYDGSDDVLSIGAGSFDNPNGVAISVHMLIYLDGAAAIRGLCESDERWAVWVGTNRKFRWTKVGVSDHEFTSYTLPTATWKAASVIYDPSAQDAELWVSGVKEQTLTSITDFTRGLRDFHLGSYDKFGLEWDGRIKRFIVQHAIPPDADITQMHDHLEGNV